MRECIKLDACDLGREEGEREGHDAVKDLSRLQRYLGCTKPAILALSEEEWNAALEAVSPDKEQLLERYQRAQIADLLRRFGEHQYGVQWAVEYEAARQEAEQRIIEEAGWFLTIELPEDDNGN